MYVRQIGHRVLTFQVSGKLWRQSLVMRDVQTGTQWSHILGKAVAGKLYGTTLKPIISDMVTWESWRKKHPDTTVLNLSRTTDRYTKEIYRHADQFVFGFEVQRRWMALPFDQLVVHPVHSFRVDTEPMVATLDRRGAVVRLFHATVDGRALTFQAVDQETMKDDQTGSLWRLDRGEAIAGPLQGSRLKQHVGIMSLRRAWKTFHPDSKDVVF